MFWPTGQATFQRRSDWDALAERSGVALARPDFESALPRRWQTIATPCCSGAVSMPALPAPASCSSVIPTLPMPLTCRWRLRKSSCDSRLIPKASDRQLSLQAIDPRNGNRLGEVHREVAAERLAGQMALVANYGEPQSRRRQPKPLPGLGSGAFWFADWQVRGSKLHAFPERHSVRSCSASTRCRAAF